MRGGREALGLSRGSSGLWGVPHGSLSSPLLHQCRDTGGKEFVAWADLAARVPVLLEEIQRDMFAKAKKEFDECLETVYNFEDFMAALDRRHMCLAPWCEDMDVEEDVKKRSTTADAMGAKTLCIPFEQPPMPEGTKCFASGRPAKRWTLWGRSY